MRDGVTQHIDIRIKNGRVIDPFAGRDEIGDVWIRANHIVDAPKGNYVVVNEIDAEGCLVLPGLIDSHRHMMEEGCDSGISVDLPAVPYGVTAAVDAGSAGSSNVGMLLRSLSMSHITTRVQINVSPGGMVSRIHPETIQPEKWDIPKLENVLERYGDKIIGFKMRTSRKVIGDGGLDAFYASVKLAREMNQRLTVHVTNATGPQNEIADALDCGDIYCHVYHNRGNGNILTDGHVDQSMWRARARGVLFDMAHGGNNFAFAIAERAISEGFLPDLISTDHTIRNFNFHPTYSLPHVMSKMLCAGMELMDVIRCVTKTPAAYMGLEGKIGTLCPGAQADVAICRLKEGDFTFCDCENEKRIGHALFVPCATILKGRLMYRSIEF